jgi:hypothetical protein
MDVRPHRPSPAPPGSLPEAETVTALLGDLRLEIEPLLARFQLDQDEAEEILREILLLLIYRWELVDSREIWLLATIKRACLRRLALRARGPARS